jgi:hypothetical protein
MELVRRTPHGSCVTYQSTFRLTYPISMMIALAPRIRPLPPRLSRNTASDDDDGIVDMRVKC